MKKFLLAGIAAATIFALSPQSFAQTSNAKPATTTSAATKPATASVTTKPATASVASKPATVAGAPVAKTNFAQGQHGAGKPAIGPAGHFAERKGAVAHGRDVKLARDERLGRDPRLVRDERFPGGEIHRDVREHRPVVIRHDERRHVELRRDHREFRR